MNTLSNLPPGVTNRMIEDFQSLTCPKHENVELELVSGDYTTGVTAPDGTQEKRREQGWYCPKCDFTYEESDIEE